MSIEDIEAAANRRLFDAMAVPAEVTLVAQPSISARCIIDRSATVTDDYGIVLEARCEIGLLVEEVGEVGRGTLVDTGKPDDRWQLLEPIGNDGFETRWTAAQT